MPWQNQGGGGGPWGGGGGPGPWGRGPSGQRPPDLEELLRRSQDRVKRYMPGGFGSGRGIIIIAVLVIAGWLLSGFYTVQPNEVGVRMIFGKVQDITGPGFNWNMPAPIGSVEKPEVTTIKRTEIGGRADMGGESSTALLAESLMLTGDENIIDIHFNVQWKIGEKADDPIHYLFNIKEPEAMVKSVSEAAMREIIGQTQFEYALTVGRAEIETRSKDLIQSILDSYGAGIVVTQVALQNVDPPADVVEAFRDVQAARANKEQKVNEAQKYFNQVTQEAGGRAQQIIKGAEAYKEQKIAIATGDAQRFLSVYNQYTQAKEITERRIYLETMEQIMQNMRKILVDTATGGSGTVPYLPLDQLLRQPPAAQPPAPAAGTSQ
ncbi:MAG TPA: FtsH protease activity modulator HflK [Methylomirabilota bacterium]|nr:FtsH protease activity modulator HflK [Methylomirabilota bacterium]